MPLAYCQIWYTTETGCGPDFERPNGYSLHIFPVDIPNFAAQHTSSDSHTKNEPPFQVNIPARQWTEVRRSDNGVRYYDKPPKPIN